MIVMVWVASCKTNTRIAQKDMSQTKSLLWKLENPTKKAKPSYIFGTIHIIDSEKYFLPKGTLAAIDQCEHMIFEIDMSKMEDMSNLMSMMPKLTMSNGKSLKDLVSDKDYKIITNHFEKIGLPLFLFEKMKPFFLTIFAEEDMNPAGLQSGEIKSYEMEFAEIAKQKNMKTGGLETIEFQLSLFDEISYEDQAKMLVDAIKSKGDNDNSMTKMLDLYMKQDIDALANLIVEESKDVSDFNTKLLINRNLSWIKPMEDMISTGDPFFIAVGAGHLGGDKGIIHLLRDKGYILTPVVQD
jgi:hypothetical protein